MNIYFLGAISGLDQFRNHYEKEVLILERMGHRVISEHILERDPSRPETFVIQDDKEYFKVMTSRIRSSDVMVADVSYPTVNIGYEISYALSNNIPIVALYCEHKGRKLSPLLVGNQDDRLILMEYELTSLELVLEEGIKRVAMMMETKFTFTISPQIGAFLEWISKKKKVSRSTYLRGLIEDKLKKDKGYHKGLGGLVKK